MSWEWLIRSNQLSQEYRTIWLKKVRGDILFIVAIFVLAGLVAFGFHRVGLAYIILVVGSLGNTLYRIARNETFWQIRRRDAKNDKLANQKMLDEMQSMVKEKQPKETK